jgi:preprotein translocase subunit SecY
MFRTFVNSFKIKELRKKILLTLLLLFIYRLGAWLPIPGINVSVFAENTQDGGFLSLLSSISGGALANGSFLALGVSPYISASIIIQLLAVAIPSLERLSKQGEEGRKKMSMYTRLAALVLAVIQAAGIVIAFSGSVDANALWQGAPEWIALGIVATVLVAGGMFTVWLGERITELGVGNGMSLLIFVGILSSAGTALLTAFSKIFSGTPEGLNYIWTLIIFAMAILLIFGLIVFVDLAERKIPVQYAKQVKGRKMYGGQSTHIPIKVNGSGVMPIIFANALLTFPQLLFSIFWPDSGAYIWYSQNLGSGTWVFLVLTALLILFFAYFYSQMVFNPEDISKRIQQQGGFIPGIRPGAPTAQHLGKISSKITLFGAIFLAFIALIPSLAMKGAETSLQSSLINAFSATGLMIVVSVALELDKQLEAQMLMRNYKGFLK